MPHRLPSLTALLYLEAAARHESFTSAARELHVTQSAVSHQVRAMEIELGISLFERGPRGSRPTPSARRIAKVVRGALASIGDCIAEEVNPGSEVTRSIISVGVMPSLANQWLVPRLRAFALAHTGWTLRPCVGLGFHSSDEVDVALRYGSGRYPGLATLPLPQEHLIAVCSPSVANSWRTAPVLQAYSDTSPRPAAPAELWARAFPNQLSREVVTFDRQSLAVVAASSDQGVAVVPRLLARDAIQRGELVQPTLDQLEDPLSYYLVWEPASADSMMIAMLSAWLSDQMQS